jgi:hypothetical protein
MTNMRDAQCKGSESWGRILHLPHQPSSQPDSQELSLIFVRPAIVKAYIEAYPNLNLFGEH